MTVYFIIVNTSEIEKGGLQLKNDQRQENDRKVTNSWSTSNAEWTENWRTERWKVAFEPICHWDVMNNEL